MHPCQRRASLLVAGTLIALAASAYAEGAGPKLGTRLPTVTLQDLAGKPVALGAVPDKVLVLNFWAFWCDTWKAQLPQLRELSGLQSELGFRLIAVSVDASWTDVFRRDAGPGGVPFTVLLDRKQALAGQLGIRRIPTVLILDRTRNVTWISESYPGNTRVLEAIRKAASRP